MALVPLPLAVVTMTSFAPPTFAGVTAVTVVAFTAVTLVAAVLPTITPVVPVMLVPVIVMVVPPVSGPPSGETEETVGGDGAFTVKAPRAQVPSPLSYVLVQLPVAIPEGTVKNAWKVETLLAMISTSAWPDFVILSSDFVPVLRGLPLTSIDVPEAPLGGEVPKQVGAVACAEGATTRTPDRESSPMSPTTSARRRARI